MSEHLFKLSTELFGHEADVRGLCTLTDNKFCSCSRDCTIRIWKPISNTKYDTERILNGHQQTRSRMGVAAVMFIKPGHQLFPAGALVSSGYDKLVLVWDYDKLQEPCLTLIGHEDAVTCLSLTIEGDIISGSADKTCRIWRGSQCIGLLAEGGHNFPIWAVLGLPNGDIVTGSGDKTIKIWTNGKCRKTLTSHSDAVRGLAEVSGIGFISASNDGVCIFHTYDGEPLQQFHGHTGFVYHAIQLKDSQLTFASCSEDTTVKIWKGTECVQTLLHPNGVWYLTQLENGDLVTAGQDGVIRIWTKDSSRALPPNEIQEYEQKITLRTAHKSGMVGDLRLDDLPSVDALKIPGSRDGEQRIVRNGDIAELYVWNGAAQQWQKVGDITNAISSPNDKKKLHGKMYDYVFDVDLGDGRPPRKLGYNVNDNPYIVAQEFIEREGIEREYMDQIVNFIISKTSPVTIGQEPIIDIPFATNRYIPGGSTMKSNQSKPVQQNTNLPPSKYFPLTQCILFESANHNLIIEKIKQFNNSLLENTNLKSVALTPNELSLIETTLTTLKDTRYYHVSSFTENEFNVLLKAFTLWPEDKRFPILDIYRLLILHPEAAKTFNSRGTLKDPLLSTLLTKDLQSNSPAANKLLAFRFISNCFFWEFLHATLLSLQEKILERIAELSQTKHDKNLSLAFSTVVLNFSVVYQLRRASMDTKLQCVSVVSELLNTEEDPEAMFRILVALGTLIYNDSETLKVFKDLGVLSAIEKQMSCSVSKVKECATDLKNLFSK